MDASTHRSIAYGVAIVLLVVGLICYAAFPKAASEEPVRIMMKNTGGAVLFDHTGHASDRGYGIGCIECHHTWDEGTTLPESCTDCHYRDGGDLMKRSDAMHMQCIGCHQTAAKAPVECSGCHMTN